MAATAPYNVDIHASELYATLEYVCAGLSTDAFARLK
jgi:hypothetical protein